MFHMTSYTRSDVHLIKYALCEKKRLKKIVDQYIYIYIIFLNVLSMFFFLWPKEYFDFFNII